MQHATATPGTPVGAIVAIAGGALLAIGSFLSWAKLSGADATGVAESATVKGIDGSDGWITLIAGVLAIVAGVVALRSGRRVLAVIALVAGLVGGAFGLYDAIRAEENVLDNFAEVVAEQAGVSVEQGRDLIDQAIDSGQLSLDVSIEIGLYLVIGGGAIAIVGGLLMMTRRSPQPLAVDAAATPMSSAPPTSSPEPVRRPTPPPPPEPPSG